MELRKNTHRLVNFDYSREALYFITICCKEHRCYLGRMADEKMAFSKWGELARDCWQQIPAHFPGIKLHEFVIMPNHLHGILEVLECADENRHTVGAAIRGFKIGVTKGGGDSIWQRDYYDHVIRHRLSHENIVEYISNNPIMWGRDKYYRVE